MRTNTSFLSYEEIVNYLSRLAPIVLEQRKYNYRNIVNKEYFRYSLCTLPNIYVSEENYQELIKLYTEDFYSNRFQDWFKSSLSREQMLSNWIFKQIFIKEEEK